MHAAYSLRAYNHSMLDDVPGQPIVPYHASARHNSVHCLVEFETKMPESLTRLTAESDAVGAVNAVRRCEAADLDKKLKKKVRKLEAKAKKVETGDWDLTDDSNSNNSNSINSNPNSNNPNTKKLHAEIDRLTQENSAFRVGNEALRAENQRLQAEHQAAHHAKDSDVRLIKSAHDTALDLLNEEMAKIKAERIAMDTKSKSHEKYAKKLKDENARLQNALDTFKGRSDHIEGEHDTLKGYCARLEAEHSTEMAGLREKHDEALAEQFSQHQQRVHQIVELHHANLEDLHVKVADTSEQLSDANTKCNSLTAKLEEAQEVIRDLVAVCDDHKKLLGTVHDMLRVTSERLPSHLKCCLLDTQRSLQSAIQRIDFE